MADAQFSEGRQALTGNFLLVVAMTGSAAAEVETLEATAEVKTLDYQIVNHLVYAKENRGGNFRISNCQPPGSCQGNQR